MLSLQSFLQKGVSLGYVGRNYNLKDLKPLRSRYMVAMVVSIKVGLLPSERSAGLRQQATGVPRSYESASS